MIYRYNDSPVYNYFLSSKKLIAERHPEIIKNARCRVATLLGSEWGYAGSVQSFIAEQYISYASYTQPVEWRKNKKDRRRSEDP